MSLKKWMSTSKTKVLLLQGTTKTKAEVFGIYEAVHIYLIPASLTCNNATTFGSTSLQRFYFE